jgi:hypothetical protein
MVDADAFNGTYTKNPFNFKNYDITTITVNGENLHGKPLQLKFGADSNYISAFQPCTLAHTRFLKIRAMV